MAVFNSQNGRANGSSAAATSAAAVEPVATAQVNLPGQAPRSVIMLGKTLSFKGELSAEEDLILFGRVEGSVKHTENLTIGVGGVVVGDVKARVITVKGTVEGDLEATESIVVSPTANVTGDLVAPRVSVVEGATFNGAVRMVKAAAGDAAKAGPSSDGVLADKTVDKMLGG